MLALLLGNMGLLSGSLSCPRGSGFQVSNHKYKYSLRQSTVELFPNAVVLNAVGRRNTQMCAKERR